MNDPLAGLKLFYVETWSKRYLFRAENTRDARLTVIYEFHDDACRVIRPATQEDVDSFNTVAADEDKVTL